MQSIHNRVLPRFRQGLLTSIGLGALNACAALTIWQGWVELGNLTGYGRFSPLPGIPLVDRLVINSVAFLPLSVDVYAILAIKTAWDPDRSERARRFARRSLWIAVPVALAGQIAAHLLSRPTGAPVWITIAVACVPVLVAVLGHSLSSLRADTPAEQPEPQVVHQEPAPEQAPVQEPIQPEPPAAPSTDLMPFEQPPASTPEAGWCATPASPGTPDDPECSTVEPWNDDTLPQEDRTAARRAEVERRWIDGARSARAIARDMCTSPSNVNNDIRTLGLRDTTTTAQENQ